MSLLRLTLAVLVCLSALPAEKAAPRLAPAYSSDSMVSSASNQPGPVAPNMIVSLYGTDLAFTTRAVEASDLRSGMLPNVLPGTGVRVLVNSLAAHIYFVSPRQVNLLIPATLGPGPAELQLVVDGRSGPIIRFSLSPAAPSLYMQSDQLAIATSATGALFHPQAPARPGDWVILYGTGFGPTQPAAGYGELARSAAPLANLQGFTILLDGVPVESSRIAYAGLAPGFAGLNQINLQLPGVAADNPQVQVVIDGVSSPPGVRLPVSR